MTHKDRMMQCIEAHDWSNMERALSSLSNMEFRRMERVMREEVLTRLGNGLFWETLLHLIIFKRAAFLSGVVAIKHLAEDGTLDFSDTWARQCYEHLRDTHEESVVKVCNMMMPMLQTETQVKEMFQTFHVEKETVRLSILLKVDTPLSYYLIFKTLKLADDKAIARKCCLALIKRQDDKAFNAVCLIKSYFGLDDLPARFSLTIEPYELSHIDRDYDTFQHVLNGKRPRV